MGLELALFGLLALVAVISAAGMILSKNAVHSALFLILNFGCVALLFLMLDAAFISMVQIAVYAGAIMVLFLFVIMLLGAEQAAETDTRKLQWVSYAGWILPLIFVIALGGTLVAYLGGLDFDEPAGDAPYLRVVHAADVADPVSVVIGDTVIENVNFADVTDFMKMDAKEYSIYIADANGATVYNGVVSLAENEVQTLVVQGTMTVDTTVVANSLTNDTASLSFQYDAQLLEPATVTISSSKTEQSVDDLGLGDVAEFTGLADDTYDVTVTDGSAAPVYAFTVALAKNASATVVGHGAETTSIQNDFESTGDDSARLIFLNLYSEDKISLVDIGRDRTLTVNGSGEIQDKVWFDELPYGEVVVPDDMVREGTYNLGFYSQKLDGSWYQVAALAVPGHNYWAVDGNTEQTVILTADYAAASPVPRVLDSAQETLIIKTNEPFGAPGDIGRILFVDYLLPVNMVGFLLLVALIGVIVLTRPEGIATTRRSTINRRRKVSRPLTNVISQQTGRDVVEDTPMLDEPGSGD